MKQRIYRVAAATILFEMLMSLLSPAIVLALTSGPTQPEFAEFEPLGTTGMVNEFTGQFTYNLPILEVPGPNGSSYPLTLAYHSNTSAESDASWVGYGWSLNPGAIQRAVRGVPDDWDDVLIVETNRQPDVQTWVLGNVLSLQAMSTDLFTFEQANRYSTMTGFSSTSGFSINLGGFASLSWRSQNGVTRFTANPNWMNILQWAASSLAALAAAAEVSEQNESAQESKAVTGAVVEATNPQSSDQDPSLKVEISTGQLGGMMYSSVANYVGRALGNFGVPSTSADTKSDSYHVNFAFTADFAPIPVVVGMNSGIRGSLTVHSVYGKDRRAWGMLYAQRQQTSVASNTIADATRERENDYNSRDLFLSPTYNMYDAFSMSAHGVSGSARFFHNTIGANGPAQATGSGTVSTIGLEGSVGPLKIGGGASIAIGVNSNSTKKYGMSNVLFSQFGYQAPIPLARNPFGNRNDVFMRVSGDLADSVRYSNTFRPERPHTAALGYEPTLPSGGFRHLNGSSSGEGRPRASTLVAFRTNRELLVNSGTVGSIGKSSLQSISPRPGSGEGTFLDRSESAIRSQIGEISVVNPNGMTYVYGLPSYSREERSYMYSGDHVRHRSYAGSNRVALGAFEAHSPVTETYRKTPYASSILLTDIYTPDYVDLGAAGPSSDDLGGYVALRYRRAAGTRRKSAPSSTEWYRWRTPYMGYVRSAERVSQPYMDRASVSMGQKELYYVGTIETKSHVAFFVTNKTNQTVTVAGQALEIKGSGKERWDAYEAANIGASLQSRLLEENLMSRYPMVDSNLATSIDPSTASVGLGKRLGRGSRGQLVNEAWLQKNTRKNKSEYLEKIVLIAKDSVGNFREVVQTVHFEYSYELQARPADWQVWNTVWNPRTETSDTLPVAVWDSVYYCYGMLNSAYRFTNDSVRDKHAAYMTNLEQYGKLTLKRVWTEYGDVKGATVSPYVFDYTYPRASINGFNWSAAVTSTTSHVWDLPRDFSATYTTDVPLNNVTATKVNQMRQNPPYDPIDVDPWGAHWRTGKEKGWTWRPFIRQDIHPGSGSGPNVYDPAAWQLKMITLPSGAQIHVQYEANTYSFVQDKPAMASITLDNAVVDNDGTVRCTLDIPVRLPGRPPREVYNALLASLRTDNRLFFKFLYPVVNCYASRDQGSVPRSSEFVSGFAPVDDDDVTFNETTGKIVIKFDTDPTPGDLLREYLFNRDGSFPACGLPPHLKSPEKPSLVDREDRKSWDKLALAGPSIAARAAGITTLTSNGGPTPFYRLSSVRIPCLWKYGGGVRVKRIFIHDVGLEEGHGGLYGTQYDYSMVENGVALSSGVATNEPTAIREENPLFRFLPGKEAASWYQRLTAGEEIDQYAGPIGEDALPPPSIGYSRTLTRSIANVATMPGFTVSRYYTARDYPVRVDYTPLDKKTQFSPLVMTGILNIQEDMAAATQGFAIHTNGMHGRLRSVTKYEGNPEGQHSIVEAITYNYFAPEDPKPVLYRDAEGLFKMKLARLGVEEDVSIDSRRYMTESTNGSISFDIGISGLFVPFAHVGLPSCNNVKAQVDISTITKVFTHPCFLKSTTVQRRSVLTTVENIAFDALTGDPRIVRTRDEYADMLVNGGVNDGSKDEYSIPAHLYYEGMADAAKNDGVIFGAAPGQNPTVTSNGGGTNLTLTVGTTGAQRLRLVAGDIVYVVAKSSTTHANGRLYRVSSTGTSTATLIVDHCTSTPYIVYGGATAVEIVVVRPARSNQLHEVAMAFTRHNEPISYTNPVPNAISRILSATATVYSDQIDQYPALSVGVGTSQWSVGQRGRWKPSESYVFRAATSDVFSVGVKHPAVIGNSGADMPLFNFTSVSSNAAEWVRMTTTTKLSPQGQAIEELNALGIPSTVVFSHAQAVPGIIAQNADAGSVVFQSYEEDVQATGPPHTGLKSMALNTSGATALVTTKITSRIKNQGLLVRAWVKARSGNLSGTFTLNSVNATAVIRPQVDGWHLFEASYTPAQLASWTLGSGHELSLSVSGATGTCYVDDIRCQPRYAASTCYVYDPSTLRLVAQFDDQHFAVIYKYDQEGRLTRKDRETIRGRFPLQEVHYNRPSIPFSADEPLMLSSSSGLQRQANSTLKTTISNRIGQVPAPSGIGGTFDALQLRINPSRIQYKVLGADSGSVRSDSALRIPNDGDR